MLDAELGKAPAYRGFLRSRILGAHSQHLCTPARRSVPDLLRNKCARNVLLHCMQSIWLKIMPRCAVLFATGLVCGGTYVLKKEPVSVPYGEANSDLALPAPDYFSTSA